MRSRTIFGLDYAPGAIRRSGPVRRPALWRCSSQALASDPVIVAIRRMQEPPEFDPDDRDSRAVARMSRVAAEGDGYRVQLLDQIVETRQRDAETERDDGSTRTGV